MTFSQRHLPSFDYHCNDCFTMLTWNCNKNCGFWKLESVEPYADLFRVKVNPRYFRPTEVDQLLGNPRKAQKSLGWSSKVKGYQSMFNPLMPKMPMHGLFLFLRSSCCKKLTLTLLTHKSPKHTIVSIEINHFLYKLNFIILYFIYLYFSYLYFLIFMFFKNFYYIIN